MSAARLPVFDRRRSGVLLHLSSLENGLGRGGRAFIDWIARAGFTVWQFLPLGPTGKDGSPYWVRSDSAGNVAFIDTAELPSYDGDDYRHFLESAKDWLDDYVMFEALSQLHNGAPWWDWPAAASRSRARRHCERPRAIAPTISSACGASSLRSRGSGRGCGTMHISAACGCSAICRSTWRRIRRRRGRIPNNSSSTGRGARLAVAGVPPDYFSELGQLWGNPLYDWKVMRSDGFTFWRKRVSRQLARVDLLRIDHFRALAAHWSVPAGAADARGGAWKRTPGRMFLKVLREECGDLPIVAEDLGIITPDVEALRKGFGLPGMRVLQFGFGGNPKDVHLPHMHTRDSIVYTGTHDNDTTLGWYWSLDNDTRGRVDFFLRVTQGSMPETLVRTALGSVGRLAIIPMQDVLSLGSEARLNTPGTVANNWTWRLPGAR